MKIYLIRHEDRTKDATFFSPLNFKGMENSKKLHPILKDLNINLVFSSPYIRTLQTISPFVSLENLSVNIDYALGESINPYIIPKNSYNVELPEYIAKLFNVNPTYSSVVKPSEMVWDEKIKHIKSRVRKFLRFILTTYTKKDVNILICSHQTTINCFLNIINAKHSVEYPYLKGKICLIFKNDKWDIKPIDWSF